MGKVFDLNGKDLTKTDATLRVPEEPADAAAVGKQSDAQTESLKAEKSRAEGAEQKLQQQVDTLNAGGLNLKEDLIRTQVDSYLTQHPEAMGTAVAEETTRAKAAEEENAKGIGRVEENIERVVCSNVVYKNDRSAVDGNGAWEGKIYEVNVDFKDGVSYYLHIDSVENCMTDICAKLSVRNGDTEYSYKTLTTSDIANGKAIDYIKTDAWNRMRITLYRNHSENTTSSGTTTFDGIRVTTDSAELVYSLKEKVGLEANTDFANLCKDNAMVRSVLDDIAKNNVAYNNDEIKVTGTAAWMATYIDTGISVESGKTYYLHIDSVENCLTNICATLKGKKGTSDYTYRELSVSDIQKGNTVCIQVANSDSIDNFQLVLYRNCSSSTVALGTTVFKGVRITVDSENIVNTIKQDKEETYWKNKKIVWFGTSIPAGVYDYDDTKKYWNLDSSYPRMVGKILGATVYNEAVGSSAMHTRSGTLITDTNPYGYQADFEYSAKTFSDSLEMKEWLIEHYNDAYWQRQRWDTMTETQKNQIRSWSWENKLNKYLSGGAVGQVDLYVFDHGFNDPRQTQHGHEYEGDTLYSFHGACNYLLEKIYQDNPKAKVVWLSHYTKNYNQSTKDLYAMQKEVCEDWDIHLVNLCDKLGWSNHEISISGHWVKQTTGQYLWVDDGVTRSTTIKDANVPDGTHPFMDGTGHSNAVIAEVIAGELNALFKK